MCEHIPYLILPVRQLSSEPFGSRRSVRRSAEPKRYTSEPLGKMPGPSQFERSAEAPRASRRAINRARLDSHHPPKRRYA